MTAIVFMDTETTGLELTDDIWEFAAIRRETDGTETEHHLFIHHDEAKCHGLPESFRRDHLHRWPGAARAVTRAQAAKTVHELTADRPHIVGAVPNFDTERLALLLRAHGHEPGWHYHLIDVENLAVGWLAGLAHHGHSEVTCGPLCGQGGARPVHPPWNSEDLSRAVGVEPAGPGVRHTAMGDARWARALYDAVIRDGLLTAPAARPHVNETSTGRYLPREPIPSETYRDTTASNKCDCPGSGTHAHVRGCRLHPEGSNAR